jgi:cbb3-type cytochrome oxidase maturation protein
MEVMIIMIPISLLLGLGFVVWFIWANKAGQYDDLDTPAHKILFDDRKIDSKIEPKTKGNKNE